MSKAIEFLESMGREASCFALHAGAGGYADRIAGLDVDAPVRVALLARDADTLGDLIGGRGRMAMQVWAPQEDEPVPVEDEPERESPQQDDDHETPERES